jgi:outer membrane protein, adhesin transport system
LLGLGLALAQPALALGLPDAVHLGLARHPEVRSSMAEVDQANTQLDISKAGYYPRFEASAGPESAIYGDLGYNLTASQMIYDWGRVESQVETASASLRQQMEALLVVREDAALDICETYLDVLDAQQRIEAVRRHIARVDELNQLIRHRAGSGYSDSSEQGRAELELARAQEQLLIEQGSLQDARQQYQELIGTPPSELQQPRTATFAKHLAASGVLDRAITRAPLYRQAWEKKTVEEAKVREADAARLPQLNLEGSLMRREIGGQMTDDSVIALRIRMDAFQGLSNFQRPKAARQRLEAANWNIDSMRRDIRRKVLSLTENESIIQWRERSLAEQIKNAQDVANAYREQFIVGLRDMTDLLGIQKEYFEAERQAITLQSEHQRVQYRAAAQLGLLVPLLENRLAQEIAP